MGLFLLPLGIFAGWVAGAAMSRRLVRGEVARLEALIQDRNGKPEPVAASAAALPAMETAAPQAVEPAKPAPSEPGAEERTPELIMILSAAVAAFLGKRARIRSARLVRAAPSSAWAQQGRVFVQASHNLGVVHGR